MAHGSYAACLLTIRTHTSSSWRVILNLFALVLSLKKKQLKKKKPFYKK